MVYISAGDIGRSKSRSLLGGDACASKTNIIGSISTSAAYMYVMYPPMGILTLLIVRIIEEPGRFVSPGRWISSYCRIYAVISCYHLINPSADLRH